MQWKAIARRVQSLLPHQMQVAALRLYRRVRARSHRGDAVFCPLCSRSFSQFAMVGSPPRRGACPFCDSRERHRLLWLYLQNETDVFTARKRLLHFAPEETLQTMFASLANLDYVSADLVSRAAQVQADITQLQFADGTFDVILCSHVLEHVPDDGRAMGELLRVLKQGGVAIVQVPIDRARAETYEDWSITSPVEREKAFGQSDHVRWYGLDFPARLEAAGFRVTAIPYASNHDVHRLGLDPYEEIYRCEKS
jgi:SAM-dependent methyltransferase